MWHPSLTRTRPERLHIKSPLYEPDESRCAASQMMDFMRCCARGTGHHLPNQAALQRFSIAEPHTFWRIFLNWTRLPFEGDLEPVCTSTSCEQAEFFPKMKLNYAEVLLTGPDADTVVVACHESEAANRLSRGKLRSEVARVAAALRGLGIVAGDRVAAVARNDAAAMVACLASAAIGASFCAATPEMGTEAILSRFSQLSPRVLFCHSRGLGHPLGERVAEIASGLNSLCAIVMLDAGVVQGRVTVPVLAISEITAPGQPELYDWPRLTFNHPLFILFSSGTTGAPKCIVHGAGGTLLEHVKEHRLHCDLRPGDRMFFHTSSAWMMWNWQLSALASGVTIILYDGAVSAPATLWRIVSDHTVTHFGTSPAYLKLCQDRGYQPARSVNLATLRVVMSTGSVLHDQQFAWFARAVGRMPLQSISGGTDIIGCFVLGSPLLPVWCGEAQCISLGMDVRAFSCANDTRGFGELVCANPFPSRPLGFFGDRDGSRFRATYFSQNPGVWTHGDFIEITERGTARIHGRSDGVLNIRGIRIGPAEIYNVVQSFPEVSQALAVGQRDPEDPGGIRLVLLVTQTDGHDVTPAVAMRIRRSIAERLSPAHVPAVIAEVAELPITHSGKLSDAAASGAVNGKDVGNAGALRNPTCLTALARHPAIRLRRGVPRRFTALPAEAPLEKRLTIIWEELFGIQPIAPDDDYFGLGGDSLLGITLMAAIEEATGQDLPLSLLLEHRTIGALASLLRRRPVGTFNHLVRLKEGKGSPVFLLPSVAGTALELFTLLHYLTTSRPVYAIQAPGVSGADAPLDRVEDIARFYVRCMRQVQPTGPYALIGYSFGGLVAYEMARLLRRAHEAVELTALLDTAIHPRFLSSALRLRLRARQVQLIWEGMRGHTRGVAVRYLIREFGAVLRGCFGEPEELHLGDTVSLPPELRRVRAACGTAYAAYRPQPYEGTILFIRATQRSAREHDPVPVWQQIARNIQVEDIPATHFTMIEQPAAKQVAAALLRQLDHVSGRSDPQEKRHSVSTPWDPPDTL